MSFYGLITHFFLLLSNIPLYIYLYHSLLINLPIEGHLGFFQVLAVTNTVAINICVWVFVWPNFSIHVGRFFIFKEPFITLFLCSLILLEATWRRQAAPLRLEISFIRLSVPSVQLLIYMLPWVIILLNFIFLHASSSGL